MKYINNDAAIKELEELVNNNKIEEARELTKEIINIDFQIAAIKMISKKDIKAALAICNANLSYKSILYIKMDLLIKMEKYKKVINICKNSAYINDEKMKEFYKIAVEKSPLSEGTRILTMLYADKITLDEIKQSSIPEIDKMYLTIAYYEKNNNKLGIQYIKKQINEEISSQCKKELNLLLDRLKSNKKKPFDITKYCSITGFTINHLLLEELYKKENDESLITKIETKEKDNESLITKIENKKEEKVLKEKEEKKIIEVKGKKVNSRNTKNREYKEIIKNEHQTLIKELFADEALEIGKYLYVKMQYADSQRNAIKAWDNLEALINKPVSDKEALKRMLALLNKMEKNNSIKINLDAKKYVKYL